MKRISFKPEFAEVINNPAMADKEKLTFILDNTIAHYNSNNRCAKGVESPGCSYHPSAIKKTISESEGCAIGRLLQEEDAIFLDSLNVYGSIESIIELEDESSDILELPPIFKKYSPFFTKLQNLHDSELNWITEGLRDDKLEYVQELKELINKLTT